jgi:DNA-directed RNA polymerase specialized sigma24 family protein
VCYWISQRTSVDADSLEDLTQKTFLRFWRYYTGAKLNYAKHLGQILAYLKTCAVSTAIEEQRRETRRIEKVEWNEQNVNFYRSVPSSETTSFQEMSRGALWALVEESCRDERERLIAQLTLVAHWKPRDIAERYPCLFPDVYDIYRIKRNLLDRLRRDPALQAMHKNLPDERLIK